MSVCPVTREPCGRLDCDPPQDCVYMSHGGVMPVESKCPLWLKLCTAAAVLYVLAHCWGPIFTKVMQ